MNDREMTIGPEIRRRVGTANPGGATAHLVVPATSMDGTALSVECTTVLAEADVIESVQIRTSRWVRIARYTRTVGEGFWAFKFPCRFATTNSMELRETGAEMHRKIGTQQQP